MKRHKHGGNRRFFANIPKQKDGDIVSGEMVYHPTKGWRSLRNMETFFKGRMRIERLLGKLGKASCQR